MGEGAPGHEQPPPQADCRRARCRARRTVCPPEPARVGGCPAFAGAVCPRPAMRTGATLVRSTRRASCPDFRRRRHRRRPARPPRVSGSERESTALLAPQPAASVPSARCCRVCRRTAVHDQAFALLNEAFASDGADIRAWVRRQASSTLNWCSKGLLARRVSATERAPGTCTCAAPDRAAGAPPVHQLWCRCGVDGASSVHYHRQEVGAALPDRHPAGALRRPRCQPPPAPAAGRRALAVTQPAPTHPASWAFGSDPIDTVSLAVDAQQVHDHMTV